MDAALSHWQFIPRTFPDPPPALSAAGGAVSRRTHAAAHLRAALPADGGAVRGKRHRFGLIYHDPDRHGPFTIESGTVGTVAEILKFQPLPDGRSMICCRGLDRFRIEDGIESGAAYLEAAGRAVRRREGRQARPGPAPAPLHRPVLPRAGKQVGHHKSLPRDRPGTRDVAFRSRRPSGSTPGGSRSLLETQGARAPVTAGRPSPRRARQRHRGRAGTGSVRQLRWVSVDTKAGVAFLSSVDTNGVDFLRERRTEPEVTQPLARDRRTSSPPLQGQPSSVEASPSGYAGEVLRSAPSCIVEAGCGAAPPSGSQRGGWSAKPCQNIAYAIPGLRIRTRLRTWGYGSAPMTDDVGPRRWM